MTPINRAKPPSNRQLPRCEEWVLSEMKHGRTRECQENRFLEIYLKLGYIDNASGFS